MSLIPGPMLRRPRWHAHSYNRPDFYRAAAGLGWLPRRARLAVARSIGRLAPRFMPAERAAIHSTLARVTGATGSRLEALTASTFTDFAMCFSDLVTTNRRPGAVLTAHVAAVDGGERIGRTRGRLHLPDGPRRATGSWPGACWRATRRAPRTWSWPRARRPSSSAGCAATAAAMRFVPRSRATISLELRRRAPARRGGRRTGGQGAGNAGRRPIPFFGAPAPFPLGPFLLARAVGVPVVPAFCLLGADRRYTIEIAEPVSVSRGGEEEAARSWVAVLEGVVRRQPTQWFNFFDVWRPAPG